MWEQFCGNWRGLNRRLVKSDKHQDGSYKNGKHSPPPPCHYRLSWAWYVGFSFHWLTAHDYKIMHEGDLWRFNDCNDLGLRRLHIHRAVTQGQRVWRWSVTFAPKFISSNSQCKSSVHGDNQRTAVDLTKVLHTEVCGTFVDSGCVLCVVQTKLNCQIKGREMGGNRWKLVNSESGSGPTSFTMFWIKDQRWNPTSFTVVGSKDHSSKPRST